MIPVTPVTKAGFTRTTSPAATLAQNAPEKKATIDDIDPIKTAARDASSVVSGRTRTRGLRTNTHLYRVSLILEHPERSCGRTLAPPTTLSVCLMDSMAASQCSSNLSTVDIDSAPGQPGAIW
ncbi:hypothetical protein GWI33_003619 [Rhynchophorus ferrugineus]|uniref:Uncharacterized protein n=1 Tax=Rhynchophorus ferrugineus TaxID=354439 RepID=A0A834LX05_RHYFE|nr:hypothetical protein GWI33_003619 [Rhynchophorus ferrugineus]